MENIMDLKVSRRMFIGGSLVILCGYLEVADNIEEKFEKKFSLLDFIIEHFFCFDFIDRGLFSIYKIYKKIGFYKNVVWFFESIKKNLNK